VVTLDFLIKSRDHGGEILSHLVLNFQRKNPGSIIVSFARVGFHSHFLGYNEAVEKKDDLKKGWLKRNDISGTEKER